MTVTYVDSSMVGAPSLAPFDAPGVGAAVIAWALPQLGWTLTVDEASTTGRVAVTNADGVTFAFFDDDTLPEHDQNVSARNGNARVLLYENFVDFTARGAGQARDDARANSFVHRVSESDSSSHTDSGYEIWGDSKSAILKLWRVNDDNAQSPLGRPRWVLYYMGRVEGVEAGTYNAGFFGQTVYGNPGTTANDVFGMHKTGPFDLLYDFAGTLNGLRTYWWAGGLTPGLPSYLGTTGAAVHPATGYRAVSRPFISEDPFGTPRYWLRGFYAPVGDWGEIMDSIDEGTTPPFVVDVGERTLKAINSEHGFSSASAPMLEAHRILLDTTGPWA